MNQTSPRVLRLDTTEKTKKKNRSIVTRSQVINSSKAISVDERERLMKETLKRIKERKQLPTEQLNLDKKL